MQRLIIALALIFLPALATAQYIYRCSDAAGASVYQDHPCENGAANAGAKSAKTNPRTRVISRLRINDLEVRQVRVQHGQCRSGSYDHLEIVGPIGPDSSEVVDRALEKLPGCGHKADSGFYSPIVYMVSDGGQLEHGYKLGHILRKYGAQTIVPPGHMCASACAVAFLGGISRTIDADGQLLFHSPYLQRGESMYCPEKQQLPGLRQYFVQYLGTRNGEFLFDRTMAFCTQRGGWIINSDAAKLFGITTN